MIDSQILDLKKNLENNSIFSLFVSVTIIMKNNLIMIVY